MNLVPFRLSVCGVGEIEGFAQAGVSHVLSILDPYTPVPAAFARFAPHRRVDFRFHDVVEGDGWDVPPPGAAEVEEIIAFGRALAAETVGHLLVHCFAGVSRSTASAAILLALDHPGREDEVFATLAAIRPRSWPNSAMIAEADRLLGRRGRMVAAMKDHHRRVAAAHPDLVAVIRNVGRGHEIPA